MKESSLPLPLSPTLATIDEALTTDPALKSKHTLSQYRSNLIGFEDWRRGRELTKSLVEAYAAHLQRAGYAPRSINQKLAAIRWWGRKVLDRAEDELPDTEETRRAIKRAARVLVVKDVKGKRLPRGRYLSNLEQEGLIQSCWMDKSPAGTRDAAMIGVALAIGLRRDDLTTLTLESIRNVQVDSCDIVAHGKGDRVDTLYLYNGGFKLLTAWLSLRGLDPGPLFCQILKNDKLNTPQHLSGEALRLILDARQVGLGLPEHITWHDLRKTFVCSQLEAGADLSTAQKNARHSSPTTTANVYDIRGEAARRDAMKLVTIGVPDHA